ncbi:MAG: NADPH-dependent 7-cyano-7-deazaguanine reductase QueF [Elusimicrobia bacterium]|nr:NADPH-dependent 7-cyano-7-deazaguanine reductase QueF [Elusimicrobiota bacterium]
MKSALYTHEHAQSGRKTGLPRIEVFSNQYPNYEITIDIPEFTSICPRTGLPDFGRIRLRYVPGAWVAELKALKIYINAYRQVGIFQENVINRILRDLVSAVRPVFCEVKGEFNARGGLSTTIAARFGKEPKIGITSKEVT